MVDVEFAGTVHFKTQVVGIQLGTLQDFVKGFQPLECCHLGGIGFKATRRFVQPFQEFAALGHPRGKG